jgi:DNA-binding MarR family transcriptional regulator
MRLLLNNGSMSSADLSRMMYVTPSNMTGIIDRLEKKDLVKRVGKQGDRRVALIVLTDTGKVLSERLPDPIENKLIKQLADLENEHVRNLAMVLKQILNLIDVDGIEATPLELGQELANAVHDSPSKADAAGQLNKQAKEGS